MITSNIVWHPLLSIKNNNSQICARAFSMPVTETATNIQCSMFQRRFSPEHTLIIISMQDFSVVNVCSKIELHNGIISIINGQ